MQTIFLDFETYYDTEYSLRKMTPAEYVLDPRFEAIGCAVKRGIKGKSYWVDGPDLQAFFDALDANDACLVTHNALFDMCIVAWRYGFIPKLMVDTLGVSRACLGHVLKSLSLASVADYLRLGVKGGTVKKVVGMGAAAIKAAGFYAEYVEYSCNDADLCAGIYERLVIGGEFPLSELLVMDSVLRCAIEPEFVIDQNALAEHLGEIQARKTLQLTQAMMVGANGKPDLMSNDKFAALLRGVGVEPPTKISPVTGRQSYAFSKTDRDFVALAEHENPGVQALIAARLGHKSTLEETRTQRLLNISNLQWPEKYVTLRGNNPTKALMPVPLRFSGAHTHRLSGDWKLNMQNLPARGGNTTLRRALTAPPGYSVFAIDASQIEARIVAWICKQQDLVDAFARGEDVYSLFASMVFGFPVNKKEHPAERFIGKTGILGLGYGVGWPKFQTTVELQSQAQAGRLIKLSDEEAAGVVTTYRSTYAQIPLTWRMLGEGIYILAGRNGSFRLGPCVFSKGEVLLPNGLKLFYHDLQNDDGEWTFTYGGNRKRIYGGALLENIVQALARIVVMDAGTRIRKRFARFNLQVHDELVYVVRTELVPALQEIASEEMSRHPVWGPELPLAAEAGVGPTYADAK